VRTDELCPFWLCRPSSTSFVRLSQCCPQLFLCTGGPAARDGGRGALGLPAGSRPALSKNWGHHPVKVIHATDPTCNLGWVSCTARSEACELVWGRDLLAAVRVARTQGHGPLICPSTPSLQPMDEKRDKPNWAPLCDMAGRLQELLRNATLQVRLAMCVSKLQSSRAVWGRPAVPASACLGTTG
jgi:hypothetical protein